MLVIFEGADGCGKSTLIKKLSKLYGWKTMVAERYDKNTFEDYYCAATCKEIILCDRSPISDIAYRLCDNLTRGPFDLYDIACILARNAKIVYCENENAFNNAMVRGEDLITDKNHHEKICKMYEIVISILEKFTNVPICKYDWSKDEDLSKVIKFIKEV